MVAKVEWNLSKQIRRMIAPKDLVVVCTAITALLISASLVFESANNWVFWLYDDTENLSIADNFFHGQGLVSNMLDKEANQRTTNIPTLATHDQISTPLYSKPPMYHLLLGAWQTIVGATYVDWYFWGSIFNLVLASSIIPVYYAYVRKNFSFEVSAISTFVMALMPVLVWHAVRLRSEILAFIFVIASLYFASKQSLRNVILMGLFTGLAHLTHPIGVLAGATLFIYLLSKTKFRSAAVFVAAWASLIIPWMVRGYIIFGDATQGLAIPVPKSILASIGLVSRESLSFTESSTSFAYIPPFETLIGMLNEFTQLHGMQFFILLIACSLAAYFSFDRIKRILSSKRNAVVFVAMIVSYSIFGMWAGSATDPYMAFAGQMSFLFALPFALYLFMRLSSLRIIFESNSVTIYSILGILGTLTFAFYIFYAQVDARVVPEVRFIAYPLSLLLPLSVIGVRKLVEASYPSISDILRKKTLIPTVTVIVVAFSILQVSVAIPIVNAYQTNFSEQEYQVEMHQWMMANMPQDAKVASDLPHAVLLRTGHESVNFYFAYKDDVQYERWIIKKFDIDYLVFYFSKSPTSPSLEIMDLGDITLEEVYRSEKGGWIYRVSEH